MKLNHKYDSRLLVILTIAIMIGTLYSCHARAANELRLKNNVIMYSPVSIGTSNTANAGATLDVEGISGGVMFPSLTTTQQNALSPSRGGVMIFNNSLSTMSFYTGSTWYHPIVSLNGDQSSLQTFANDTNVTITTSGGTHTLGWSGQLSIARGGTGQATKSAAFDALSPNATTGDLTYYTGSTNAALAGNTTSTKKFLNQTGTGSASAAPLWSALIAGDIPTLSYVNLNGSTPLTANWDVGGVKLTNLAAPTSTSDASTKNYVDTAIKSLASGGTNANLTAAAGGAVYSGSTGLGITAAGTSGQVLTSNGSSPPTWQAAGAASTTTYSWSGHFGSNCLWGRANTAVGDFGVDSTCTFTEDDNSNFGTVTAANDGTSGHQYPGIHFSPPATGHYYVCFTMAAFEIFNASEAAEFSLFDSNGAVNFGHIEQSSAGALNLKPLPKSVCTVHNWTSTTATDLKLQAKVSANEVDIGSESGYSNALQIQIFLVH